MSAFIKRKALGSLENVGTKAVKQPRLDAFFRPKAPDGAQAGARPGASQAEATRADEAKSSTTTGRHRSDYKSVSGPKLSEEQKAVLRMVVDEGKSIFFTGSAGEFGCSHVVVFPLLHTVKVPCH